MLRIVGDGIGLADPARRTALGQHEVVRRDAAGIGNGERMGFDRMADRPPHLDDGKPLLEQFVRLVGQDVLQPLRGGLFGVVVVGAPHHLADFLLFAERIVGGSQRVIEHDDPPGAALGFDQRLHLRIVDAPEFSLVEEVLHSGIVVDEAEAVHVELEFVQMKAAVVHDDLVGIGRAA